MSVNTPIAWFFNNIVFNAVEWMIGDFYPKQTSRAEIYQYLNEVCRGGKELMLNWVSLGVCNSLNAYLVLLPWQMALQTYDSRYQGPHNSYVIT